MSALPVVSILVVLVLMLSLQWRLTEIERQVSRVARLDVKLDLLLKHAGVEYDPYKTLPPEVINALLNGQKIQAIKLYREASGVGLKDAKDFIEDAQRRAGDLSRS
jgi:ribosomal protein L7/L12